MFYLINTLYNNFTLFYLKYIYEYLNVFQFINCCILLIILIVMFMLFIYKKLNLKIKVETFGKQVILRSFVYLVVYLVIQLPFDIVYSLTKLEVVGGVVGGSIVVISVISLVYFYKNNKFLFKYHGLTARDLAFIAFYKKEEKSYITKLNLFNGMRNIDNEYIALRNLRRLYPDMRMVYTQNYFVRDSDMRTLIFKEHVLSRELFFQNVAKGAYFNLLNSHQEFSVQHAKILVDLVKTDDSISMYFFSHMDLVLLNTCTILPPKAYLKDNLYNFELFKDCNTLIDYQKRSVVNYVKYREIFQDTGVALDISYELGSHIVNVDKILNPLKIDFLETYFLGLKFVGINLGHIICYPILAIANIFCGIPNPLLYENFISSILYFLKLKFLIG